MAGGDSRPRGDPQPTSSPPHQSAPGIVVVLPGGPVGLRNETEKGVTCRAHAVLSVARLQAEGRKGLLIKCLR